MNKVKIAVIGCGQRAAAHISNFAKFPDVELVGFYDFRPERAEAFARAAGEGRFGFYTFEEMLDATKPDALLVAVPPDQHGDIEFAAINRGISLLIEPPMTLDPALADQIRDAAEEKGVLTAVAFQDRYLDVIQKISALLADRKPALVSATLIDGIHGPYWWPFEAASGGQITEQSIHLLDLCRYLFGDATKTYCAGGSGIITREDYDIRDYSSSVITFKNGVIANLFTGCYATSETPAVQNGLRIYCDTCCVDYLLEKKVTVTENRKITEYSENGSPVESLDRAFADAVMTGNSDLIRSSYGDACSTLKLAIGCTRSIETGMPEEL